MTSVRDLAWEPWSPAEVARRLAEVRVAWCVAGGWALDLFRGSVSREHHDIEIAVPSAGFGAIRAALEPELVFDAVGSGQIWPVDGPAFDSTHQTWGRDRVTGAYRLDVFRDPHDGDTWVCRRSPSVRRPYSSLIGLSADGIPYLAPEVVLLFKAKATRPKDEADMTGVLPLLAAAQLEWLAGALRIAHPGRPWLDRLLR